jgi:hypothetical protein
MHHHGDNSVLVTRLPSTAAFPRSFLATLILGRADNQKWPIAAGVVSPTQPALVENGDHAAT